MNVRLTKEQKIRTLTDDDVCKSMPQILFPYSMTVP